MDPVTRAQTFARLSRELSAEPAEGATAQRIVELAIETVAACDHAGISLRRAQGRVESPAASSELVRECDDLQERYDEGPCLEAIRGDDTYVVDDTRTDPRWPLWCRQVAELGIGSVLSVKLAVGSDTLGALNLYAFEPGSFEPDDVLVAQIYAEHAAVALGSAQLATGLRTAMASRHRIGVAQGILMQRYGLSLPASFEVLLRYSRDHNLKLRDVAQRVVETGAIPDVTATVEPTAEPPARSVV